MALREPLLVQLRKTLASAHQAPPHPGLPADYAHPQEQHNAVAQSLWNGLVASRFQVHGATTPSISAASPPFV